jgi:hypothetical protein
MSFKSVGLAIHTLDLRNVTLATHDKMVAARGVTMFVVHPTLEDGTTKGGYP